MQPRRGRKQTQEEAAEWSLRRRATRGVGKTLVGRKISRGERGTVIGLACSRLGAIQAARGRAAFPLRGARGNSHLLKPFRCHFGSLLLLTVESLDHDQNYLIFSSATNGDETLEQDAAARLLTLPGKNAGYPRTAPAS